MNCRLQAVMILTATFSSGAHNNGAEAKPDQEHIQGVWQLLSAEEDGTPCATAWSGALLLVEGDTMGVAGWTQLVTKFTLRPVKSPREIDFAWPGMGPGIYAVDDQTLKLCFVERRALPRPSHFATKPGDGRSLFVFHRTTLTHDSHEAKVQGMWDVVSYEYSTGPPKGLAAFDAPKRHCAIVVGDTVSPRVFLSLGHPLLFNVSYRVSYRLAGGRCSVRIKGPWTTNFRGRYSIKDDEIRATFGGDMLQIIQDRRGFEVKPGRFRVVLRQVTLADLAKEPEALQKLPGPPFPTRMADIAKELADVADGTIEAEWKHVEWLRDWLRASKLADRRSRENAAKTAFEMAERLMKAGRRDAAKRRFEEIVREYPGTDWERRSKQHLDRME